MNNRYYGHQGPAVGSFHRQDKYKSIAVKLAAFCCRLHGMDDVPEEVRKEAIKLAHEFKQVEAVK